MTRFYRFSWVLGTGAALGLASCSLQNFDYLKDEYHPAQGGSSGSAGSSANGSGAGGTQGNGESGATSIAGTTSGNGGSSGTGVVGVAGQTGSSGSGGASVGMLMNPGFELPATATEAVPFWKNAGTMAAATTNFIGDAHTGSGRLGHWLMAGAYIVSTSQVVAPIPNGNYTFSIWIRHAVSLNQEYIFAKGYSHSEPAAQMQQDSEAESTDETVFAQVVLGHIPVTNNSIEVGLYTDGGSDNKNNWSIIDDAALVLETQ